jgi:hypothetical protein
MPSPQMMNPGRPLPPAAVMTSRIIWAALIAGPVVFAILIPFIHADAPMDAVMLNVMLAVDVVMFVVGLGFVLLLPRFFGQRQLDDQARVLQTRTVMLIQMAFMEGVIWIGLVLVFLSGKWWPGAIVPAIAMVVQLTRFPRSTTD